MIWVGTIDTAQQLKHLEGAIQFPVPIQRLPSAYNSSSTESNAFSVLLGHQAHTWTSVHADFHTYK